MRLDPAELARVIASGEGRGVEFKRGLPRDEKTARTLCAFANTRGGMLLVGVGDRREVLGVARPAAVVARLRAIAAQAVEPALALELCVLELEGRAVVCCSVPLSARRPHSVAPRGAGGAREVLVRVGSSNRAASGATLRAVQAGCGPRRSLTALERSVLAWVERRTGGARGPESDATAAAFAKARNVGVQRARRAFVDLERSGRLVGHGMGARRVYSLP